MAKLNILLLLALCGLFTFNLVAVAEQPQAKIINLGMISPLTGDLAPYGEHIKRGVELAQADLKSKGIDAKIFYEDACVPVQARGAVSKLVSVDAIDGLVGSYCVFGMVPSASILEKAHIVAFHTSVVPQELLGSGEYVFTTNARIGDEAHKLAEYAFNTLKARKVAVLYLTTQWGEEYQKYFVKKFRELGGEITGSETNPIGANDFRSELTRLKSKNPDALLIVHVGITLANALKEANQLGFNTKFLTVNEAEEQDVIDLAQNYAEGIKFYAPEPAEETAVMTKFDDEFRKRFTREPHPLSRHSYDATMLVGTALSECHSNHECAKDKLYQIKDYSGASGVFSIERDGGVKREFVLKTVKDGHFIRVNELK